MMNPYIGHESQLYGVEEHQLVGGKGDGIRLLQVKNGKGMEFTVSRERCADIARLSFCGRNMSFFSPCGYVSPAYYDDKDMGFLKSFTAGFLATCGLSSVGSPSVDDGKVWPLHGTIGNTPADHIYWRIENDAIHIHALVRDENIFFHKLVLHREIICSLKRNELVIRDRIENCGDQESPAMLLYHINIGYPLLSERSEIYIPSTKVIPRNSQSAEDLNTWNQVIPPQKQFKEQCYFHNFEKKGIAAIYNPDIELGMAISFDAKQLNYFTEWKMMGIRDYVLGLEPGNCHPDGRAQMKKEGKLTIIKPGESISYEVEISMLNGRKEWNEKEKK